MKFRQLWLMIPAVLLLPVLLLLVLLWLSPQPALYPNYQQSSAFFDANGQLLSLRLAADERYRLQVPLEQIAPALQQATLLYEDRRFYQHYGVDFSALGRAFWQTFVKSSRRQGASTLTMQLARLRFDINSSQLSGKFQQIFYALLLERHYSKAQILEAYFNYVPYGGNIESAAAASLIYFGKEVARLTEAEALALAVIPQNPVQRNPQSVAGMAQMEQARQRLAEIWQQHHPDMTAMQQQRLQLPLAVKNSRQLPYYTPHFINQLLARPAIFRVSDNGNQRSGRFYTSLDLDIQQQFERRVADYLSREQQQGLQNASVLLVNRHSMQVKAWIGSADFYNNAIAGQVDGVTALRSPGSTLKPFVYALGLQQGLIHPLSLLKDLPRRFGTFNPENFDQQFYGPVSAARALVLSRNLPAVQLQQQLNTPDFYQWLTSSGISLPQTADYYGLALVLGGMEVSMQQLVQLYGAVANRGQLQLIDWRADTAMNTGRQVLSPESAFLTLDMLRQHPSLHTDALQQLTIQPEVAWKTGTSYAFRDAWTVGVSGDYILAVWLGNFDGSSNPNLIGVRAAAPLFFSLLATLDITAASNQALFTPEAALNLRKVAICTRSGELPNKYCPHTTDSWFIPGVSPIRVSNVHRALPVFTDSGKRACMHQPPLTRLDVFEFWPSDIVALYRSAGIHLRQPPAFATPCAATAPLQQQAPQIRTPQQGLVYQLSSQTGQDTIALQATFDGDVTLAHWFSGSRYLGAVKPGETLFWQAAAGQHQLRVVDDNGGVDTVNIRVMKTQ